MKKRIVIADDHALMLEGLARLLCPEFEIVGMARDGRELLEQAESLRPDVILLDVVMPGLNGIDAARRLSRTLPSAKLVFVTQYLDQAYLHAAFVAGAHAYVAKQSATAELIQAIRMALQSRYYVTPLVSRDATQTCNSNPRQNPAALFGNELTPRQREVLQLVSEGKSSKEISVMLNISVKTVEFHRNRIMDELGVHSIAELTRYAIFKGVVNS